MYFMPLVFYRWQNTPSLLAFKCLDVIPVMSDFFTFWMTITALPFRVVLKPTKAPLCFGFLNVAQVEVTFFLWVYCTLGANKWSPNNTRWQKVCSRELNKLYEVPKHNFVSICWSFAHTEHECLSYFPSSCTVLYCTWYFTDGCTLIIQLLK